MKILREDEAVRVATGRSIEDVDEFERLKDFSAPEHHTQAHRDLPGAGVDEVRAYALRAMLWIGH